MSLNESALKESDSSLDEALATPVMRQYMELKKDHPDSILLFRMGDFYEMFLEDAKKAAPVLDVALTRRQNAVPMAGVPYHALDTYLARLISGGLRVAIAEQAVDPENPKLMRRLVTRVVSPGTVLEESLLTENSHSYLLSIVKRESAYGVAIADVTTRDFRCLLVPESELRDFVFRINPAEILCSSEDVTPLRSTGFQNLFPLENWKANEGEGIRQIESLFKMKPRLLGIEPESPAAAACSLIIHHLLKSFPTGGFPLPAPVFETANSGIGLDEETIRNLELVQTSRGATAVSDDRTLYGILNRCKTAAGRRLLRETILTPLSDKSQIKARQAALKSLNPPLRTKLFQILGGVRDLERILARLDRSRGGPQDFHSVRLAIESADSIRAITSDAKLDCSSFLNRNENKKPGSLTELAAMLRETVVDDPPAVLGGAPFLKPGIRKDLDEARAAKDEGTNWVLAFEEEEKKKTGLPLKVRYNRVHGYYIELTKSQIGSAPPEYRRRQTLVGAERYTTDRLAELEEKITGAHSLIEKAERQEFDRLTELVIKESESLKRLMNSLAAIDLACALTETAERFNWCIPEISESDLKIKNGRHPVVESFLTAGESFIANDLDLSSRKTFAILTGPNMAGKSTYVRQVALIQLLFQIGSLVPAESASLPVCDGIFTRIGASDNLSRGESTFFVEMLETARILRKATGKSLVILDEVGRGTSTYDGLSIAWAIVEALSSDIKPKVLFATHYHELTVLDRREGVFNLTMDVREIDGRIHFLRKVREGAADRSYGIAVAELAGLPDRVIRRAREKLAELESGQKSRSKSIRFKEKDDDLQLF